MTKEEVKLFIERLEANYVMMTYPIGLIHHPTVKNLLTELYKNNIPSFPYKNVQGLGRKYDMTEVSQKFFSNSQNNLDYLYLPMMSLIGLIHDIVINNGYNKTTPEFEFFRHIRNAMSHGNRFKFLYNEPKRTASFEGFIIDSSLEGTSKVLGNFISLGDALNLINFIKMNL